MFERMMLKQFNLLKTYDKYDTKFAALLGIENYYRFPKEGEKIFETKQFKIFKILDDLETTDFVLYKGEIFIYFAPDISISNELITTVFKFILNSNFPKSTIFSVSYNDRGGKNETDEFVRRIDNEYELLVNKFHVLDIGGWRKYKDFMEYNLIKFKQK